MADTEKMLESAIELYQVLSNCKDGMCTGCPRYEYVSSNSYSCRKKLLQDCFEFVDLYIAESEG